ncbi:thiazolylpeptide-type bacteriocin [Streptomyces sp. NPDC101150]
MEQTPLTSLAAQLEELESETFEIQDYAGTNEELLGGSTSTSSTSSSSSS